MDLADKTFFHGRLAWILTAAVFIFLTSFILSLVISPLEFVRMQRDRWRTEDLQRLSELIELAQADVRGVVRAEENIVYISLPDNNPDCSYWKESGLPSLSGQFAYRCSRKQTYRAVDGSGWLPIDFRALPAGDIRELPIDPANGRQGNDSVTGQKRVFFYQYIQGSFSLGAFSERPPSADDIYGAAKKQESVKAVLGIAPTGATVGGGGQMIAAGAVDLLNKANASIISAAGRKIERDGTQAALEEVREAVNKLPPPAKEMAADRTAAAIFKELGIIVKETPTVKKALEGLKEKSAVEHIQQIKERVQREIKQVEEVAEAAAAASPPKITEEKINEVESRYIDAIDTAEAPSITEPAVKPTPENAAPLAVEPLEIEPPAPVSFSPKAAAEEVAAEGVVSDILAINERIGAPSLCGFYIGIGGAEIKPENLRPAADDADGDGLSDEDEINGNPATNPRNPDSDGDCVTDGAEAALFTNPASGDTDGDGYADYFEIVTFGAGPISHPFLTVSQARNTAELLSNSALARSLSAAGYLKEGNISFAAPAALNPFYPDKDGDGVGDLWEIFFYGSDSLVSENQE